MGSRRKQVVPSRAKPGGCPAAGELDPGDAYGDQKLPKPLIGSPSTGLDLPEEPEAPVGSRPHAKAKEKSRPRVEERVPTPPPP